MILAILRQLGLPSALVLSTVLVLGAASTAQAQSGSASPSTPPTATPSNAQPNSQTTAQPGGKNAPSSRPAAPASGKVESSTAAASSGTSPLWRDLTLQQQASLKPLAANWATIDEAQKRKWLALSNNYPMLVPAEQQKMHSRMAEWASLSRQQRSEARLNFAESNKLAPKEKAAKTATWEAYQALSAEEKQKLAEKAAPKPAGAAMAVKPPPPEKLATVPSTRLSPKIPANEGNALQPRAAGATPVPGVPAASGTAGSAAPKN